MFWPDSFWYLQIVPLLNAYLLPPAPPTQEMFLTFMPFYPCSLKNLLDAPAFCSQSVPWLKFSAPLHTARPDPDLFMTRMCYIALSMTFAVSYIHSKKIAHRDLNPHNWMLTAKGVVTLLDFGAAWGDSEVQSEKRGELHFDVGTS
jgi:serine/threonine protein kinase